MPHVERNIEIDTSVEKVFEPGKYAVKGTIGDFTTTRTETVQNEKISMSIEGGPFSAMGYILSKKGDKTNATLWADFEDGKQEKMLVKAGELLLKSLKNFVEFVDSGGNPDEYDKKQVLVSP